MFSQFSKTTKETHARADRQRIHHEHTNSFVFFVRWMTLSKFHLRESVCAHHIITPVEVFPFYYIFNLRTTKRIESAFFSLFEQNPPLFITTTHETTTRKSFPVLKIIRPITCNNATLFFFFFFFARGVQKLLPLKRIVHVIFHRFCE